MKIGFFDEKEGVKSITRLKTFIAAIAGVGISVASVALKDVTIGDALPMVITLLGYSAGTKVFQKFAEKKV